LNPKKPEYEWSLGFNFGLHNPHIDKWPGDFWDQHSDRWAFSPPWFLPLEQYGWPYNSFRSLAELELGVRFHSFAYKLIYEDFQEAILSAIRQAEAEGALTSE
jgi:hypothetical protein